MLCAQKFCICAAVGVIFLVMVGVPSESAILLCLLSSVAIIPAYVCGVIIDYFLCRVLYKRVRLWGQSEVSE